MQTLFIITISAVYTAGGGWDVREHHRRVGVMLDIVVCAAAAPEPGCVITTAVSNTTEV